MKEDPALREMVNVIISAYHTTRMADTPASVHILAKPHVQRAVLRAIRGPAQWYPVETAPKGEYVLLCGYLDGPHDPRIKMGYWCRERESWVIDGASWTPVWWQPRPAPPRQPD